MIPKAERVRLHFGPYRAPRFNFGSVVSDEIRGDVKVVGLSDARIPWPIGRKGRAQGLVVTEGLVRAVRQESVLAVSYWWGITDRTVTVWRRALGVPGLNEGSHRLRVKHGKSPTWRRRILRKAWAKANDPERIAKLAATLKGRQLPGNATQAALAARRASLDEASIRRLKRLYAKKSHIAPQIGPRWKRIWSAREDHWVKTLPPSDAIRKTGRSAEAVYCRRRTLGIVDEARRAAALRGGRKPSTSTIGRRTTKC